MHNVPPKTRADEETSKRVVLLAEDSPATRIVYHAIASKLPNTFVVLEDSFSRAELICRRVKRLGIVATAGQLAFMLAVPPILHRLGAARIATIKRDFCLDDSPIPADVIRRVPSVNSAAAREELLRLQPSVVVVNGTRILRRETLSVIQVPILNVHAGITPRYRGVHGGYWALFEGRPDLVGTTIHLVDQGIDTGRIVRQALFRVSREDSFVTYPYLHLAAGIPILIRSIQDALDEALVSESNPLNLRSVLRHHPTIWGYLGGWIRHGAR